MIQLVDKALEQFLRDAVPLPESAVDVSFDAPDRTWGASVTRPTVNIFLYELTRNPNAGRASFVQRRTVGDRVERRPANPVVDLHYLVTAWATEQRDEHQLLGAILGCVLANSALPATSLPEELQESGWISLSLSTHDKRAPGEFWSALDGRLKPGLEVELSLPMDVFAWQPTAPAAASIGVQTRFKDASVTTPGGDDDSGRPLLRRRRMNGVLFMEGRAPEPSPDEQPTE